MTFYRRNRERKEISRPSSGTRKGFLLISIIVFLQSFSFGLTVDNSICEGKPMGYAFEDPDNCASYFECIFGEAEANNCSPGYKFDAVSEACVVGSCDSVTTTTTETPTTENPTTEAPTTESQTTLAVDSNICEGKPMGWTFEDRDDCTRYFECIFGKVEANNCPTGKKWDAVTESCIDGNCESVITTTTEDPTTENLTTEDAVSESSTTANPTTEDAITESPTTANPTTLAVDKSICKDQEMGWRFEDPNDCTGFFECIGDEAEANNCFPGFKYDAASQLCVVGECETATTTTTEDPTTASPTTQSTTTPSPTTESTTTQSPTTETPTTQSPTTQSSTTESPTTQSPTTQSSTTESPTTQSSTTENPTTQSPTTQSTTTKKPTTSSTEPGIECPAGPICQPSEHGTVHRDARDCRKFYVCRNGEAITHLCDKGKFFDENTNLCNFDVLVQCTPCTIDASTTSSSSSTSTSTSTTTTTLTSTTTPTTLICQSEPNCKSEKTGFMYRDPKDCSKFYICINGIAYGRSCRKGEYFDLNVFACLFSSVVECIPNKNCLPTSSKIPQVTSTPRPISTSTSRALVLNGQVDPNFTDCLNLPNGSVKRHPVHCSVFYVCRNGMAIKQTCMYKQFFDENKLVCNFRVLVDCPSGLY